MAGDVKRILVPVVLAILLCLAVIVATVKIAWVDRAKSLKERAGTLGKIMGLASLIFAILLPWMLFSL